MKTYNKQIKRVKIERSPSTVFCPICGKPIKVLPLGTAVEYVFDCKHDEPEYMTVSMDGWMSFEQYRQKYNFITGKEVKK